MCHILMARLLRFRAGMERRAVEMSRLILPVLIALASLSVSGCRWMAPQHRASATDVDQLDEETLREEYRRLLANCAELEVDRERREEELARRTIEVEDQREANRLLQAELDATLTDLHYLESQFITLEAQLSQDESKASAVAAMADVQLLYGKFHREHRELLSDDEWEEVDRRLAAGEEAIANVNFTAAVYHAHRAMRMLNHSARQQQSYLATGTPRVVKVSSANYRKGPGADFGVLGQLARGTVVVEMSRNKDWSEVRTRSGQVGWIHASLIR
jgi:hypothetical protein